MKKTLLFLALLPAMTVTAVAQESRQDVSISGIGFIAPNINRNGIAQSPTDGYGGLASYRYMLTPRSALEGNFGETLNSQRYVTSFNNVRIRSRNYEASAAYVLNFNFRNFNPFLEAGAAGMFFRPQNQDGTTTFDTKAVTNIGGLYGAGIAYEISPSFDIRAEYRGIVVKAPSFGLSNFNTGQYTNLSLPAIGVAYHF